MRRRRVLRSLGPALLLLALVMPAAGQPRGSGAAPEAAFGGWVTETVDSAGDVGSFPCQDLDSAGYPHVGYYANGVLKYAYQDAGGWRFEIVDSAQGTGRFCSLKVDAGGRPHISYYDGFHGDLKYAYRDAGGWHVEIVDPTNATGEYTSLDLDAGGYPHISYEYVTGRALRYAYQDAGGWHVESPPAPGVVYKTALALDDNSWPHIAYYDDGGKDIYYGCKDGAGWRFEIAVDHDAPLRGPALALDASGAPYIAYSTGEGVYYAHKNGAAGWTQESIDQDGGATYELSLVLDSAGRAHLSYGRGGVLKYGERGGSGWRTFVVDPAPSVGAHNAMAVDAQGRPRIAYFDAANLDLKYARLDASWYGETIAGGVGNHISLQYDSYNRPRACFYDAANQDLVYAWRDAAGWHTEAVDTQWDAGQYCSLALDAAGYPHISYYYATESDLRYAYKDGAGWHIEDVDASPASFAGKWTSLVLDAQGRPHISYFHESLGQLRHAYKDGAGWHIEVVDGPRAGMYTSIAMDPSGTDPRIAYQKNWGELYYARKGVGGWQKELVFPNVEAPAGLYNSLRIDAADRPHIAFARSISGSWDLLYAYEDGGGWHPAFVDSPSAGSSGLWNSLVLDAAGLPHIATLDQTAGELRYAWKAGETWYTLPLARVGTEGGYSSLAVDADDHLGVAYYNAAGPQEVDYVYNNCLSVAAAQNAPACVNTEVSFDNCSVGVLPVEWNWSFGDGATSTAAYPTHTYTLAGVYRVTLGAANSCGAGEAAVTQVISSTPTAGFTYTAPACAGSPVQFQNTTVASPTVYYTWTFGDGEVSHAVSPTHTYAHPGSYLCHLAAVNGCGQDATEQTVTAHSGPELGAPTWVPALPEIHQAVLFTVRATSTLPVDYAWDFGDGGTGSGVTVSHAYAAAGDYRVTVTGTTGCGADAAQAVVSVVCHGASADGLAWTPETPTLGAPTTFSATVSGSAPLSCTWDFGDGAVVGPFACGGPEIITHTFAATGTYVVALTATNECGAAVVSGAVTVVARPQAAFRSNSPLCLGQTTVFTNTSSGAEPLSFLWAFGDGYTSTLRNPTHNYAEGGTFVVSLTATNPYGTSAATDTVEVRNQASHVDFDWAPAVPAPGQPVTLSAEADGAPPISFEWSLGDGFTATGQVVVHTYAVTGTYTVTLYAHNDCGGQVVDHELSVSFCTAPSGLTAAFTPTVPAPHEVVHFTATLAAGSSPTIAWDFGDGSAWGYGETVTHTFAAQGTYTASVAAWNRCGYAGPVNLSVPVRFPAHPGVIHLPLVYKGYCRDPYEPDDSASQARPLALGDPQRHNFDREMDEDWMYLTLAAGQTYRFWTSDLTGGADTRLYLYPHGQYGAPVAQNDDWSSGNCGGTPPDPKQSCFLYAPSQSGVFELKVNQYTGGARWGCDVGYTVEAAQP